MTFRCAELSLELDEPLAGSAPVAARWELVERAKPWGRKHGLVAEDAKVLLVKPWPGVPPSAMPRDLVPGQRRYLVCTNGARDPCCAIRGPAVAQALARIVPGQVYECSHLGGHRFAANVLVLPDELCFGRLDARAAAGLAAELEEGRLPLDHLRGRTTLRPEEQAAEILVRRELGLSRLDDLRHVEGATFELADGRRATARLHGTELEPHRLSCRDDRVESATRWALADLVLA